MVTLKKRPLLATVVIAAILTIIYIYWSHRQTEYRASGGVMGTTWHVVYLEKQHQSRQQKKIVKAVSDALRKVDNQMSTYKNTSELMRLNNWPLHQPFPVSPELTTVLQESFSVSALSQGAYDVTVGSLVNLWGFGPDKETSIHGKEDRSTETLPSRQAITQAKKETGYRYVQLDRKNQTVIKTGNVFIDLSSIAKGYGVDQAAKALESHGIHNYLVEVGGEVHASGKRPDGKPWQVAIVSPDGNSETSTSKTVGLNNVSMATSGDYFNYHQINHVRYSHEINPATGWPEKNNIASVSVIAKTTMLADALSTMFMILSPEKGQTLAREKGLAVYIIYRQDHDKGKTYTTFTSPAFDRYLHSIGDST